MGASSDPPEVIHYDLDTCEEFCECVGRIVSMLDVMEDELGKAYADEYRRQLADLIVVARRDDVPSPAAWPGLRVAADGTRRALRQPTSAPLPGWTHAPGFGRSAQR